MRIAMLRQEAQSLAKKKLRLFRAEFRAAAVLNCLLWRVWVMARLGLGFWVLFTIIVSVTLTLITTLTVILP